MKRILTFLVLILAFIVVSGCEMISDVRIREYKQIELDLKLVTEGSTSYWVGTANNTNNKYYSTVYISISLEDKETKETFIDDIYVSNVKANEITKIKSIADIKVHNNRDKYIVKTYVVNFAYTYTADENK